MQVILFNTSNGSAFEMQFSNAKQMKNYLEKNAEVEFLSDANSLFTNPSPTDAAVGLRG